jgi:hypothetical protein
MTLTPLKLCTRPLCLTCLQRLPLTPMILTHSLLSRVLTDFSFSLRSLPVSHVEGSSLTTSLRYQALLSFFVIS